MIIPKRKIYLFTILTSLFFIFSFTIPAAEAHVLIIADADGTTPDLMIEAKNTANTLNSKGYKVLTLYQKNATTKNIMKGMYNADAVIYLGHGGYEYGHYDENGGTATPPFAMVGSDDFIWGVNDKMREGWNGKLITAPYKSNIPVILAHACFSTGYVDNDEVSNPIETIHNFSQMFTGGGANYYATGYSGYYNGKIVVDMVDDFLNGATNFKDANIKNSGKTINTYTAYNGEIIWRNDHGYAAFVGNWYSKFPLASQTTPYDDKAAEAWYQSVYKSTDLTPPKIISHNPSANAVTGSIVSPVTITFSENIIAGPNFTGITIKNINTGENLKLSATYTSGSFLSIKPSNYLSYNTNYQVYIPTGAVKDGSGNKLMESYSFNFKTMKDTVPPKILSTSPANKATGVSLTSLITITFNEYVKAGTCYQYIYIKNLNTGKKVSALKAISKNVLILKVTSGLLRYNLYQVYIPADAVRDISSNKLASAYSFIFKTLYDITPPRVVRTSPLNYATGVSLTSLITITFNEYVKAGTGYQYIYIKNLNTGKKVSILKAISKNVLVLKMSTSRIRNNQYLVYIPTGVIRDLSGNIFKTGYCFRFRTIR